MRKTGKVNPLWWLVGVSVFIGFLRVGAEQTAPNDREVIPVGAKPASELLMELIKLDGVTDPKQMGNYGSPMTMLQVSCEETPESLVSMVIDMTNYDRSRGYTLTHLDMLKGFYDMVSASPQKVPRDCSALYDRYMGR